MDAKGVCFSAEADLLVSRVTAPKRRCVLVLLSLSEIVV